MFNSMNNQFLKLHILLAAALQMLFDKSLTITLILTCVVTFTTSDICNACATR
jgi:hypothetical protein